MASIRKLKKGVKHWIKHFLQECCTHLAYSPNLNLENVLQIIADAMALEREVIAKICRSELKDKSESKKYYQEVRNYFLEQAHQLIDRFNNVA